MKYKRFYINFLFLFFYSNFISLAQSPSNIYDKLEVAGNIKGDTLKAKSLRVTSNPLTGKVLTSDAQGNATWQTLPDLSPWSIAG